MGLPLAFAADIIPCVSIYNLDKQDGYDMMDDDF